MGLDFGCVSAFIATTICGYRLFCRHSFSLFVRLIWSLVSLLFIAYIVYCCISHLTILRFGTSVPFYKRLYFNEEKQAPLTRHRTFSKWTKKKEEEQQQQNEKKIAPGKMKQSPIGIKVCTQSIHVWHLTLVAKRKMNCSHGRHTAISSSENF